MQFCHHAHDMICFYPRDPYSATVSRPVREQDTVKIVLTFLPHDTQERKVLRSDIEVAEIIGPEDLEGTAETIRRGII